MVISERESENKPSTNVLINKLKKAGLDKGKDYEGYKRNKVYLYPHEIEDIKKLWNMSNE